MPQRKKLAIGIPFFFAIVAILLAEANFVFYVALADIFNISQEAFLFGLLMAVLSGGFVVMLMIEKYYTNKLINFFYLTTSIWIGVFVYFFTAAIVYLTASIFFDVPNIVGVGLFLAAGIVSLYGILHGRKIIVKNIQVSLPMLPAEWKGRKAVFMSDIHLNSIRADKFAKRITDISNSLTPDIIFIGGDLYDGTPNPKPLIIGKPLENLSSKLGTYFILGNHEEFHNPDIFLAAVKNLGMKVLRDEMGEVDGVQIIGVDYLSTVNKKNFQRILEDIRIDKNKPSILLKHEPKDLSISKQAGISFQLSGHTHDGQQWPFNYLTDIVYKGFGYGLKHYHGMPIFVSSGVGGWGPPLRVGSDYEIVCITFN